jgi:hypothetical protein
MVRMLLADAPVRSLMAPVSSPLSNKPITRRVVALRPGGRAASWLYMAGCSRALDEPLFAESVNQRGARGIVVGEGPGRDVARIPLMLFGSEEAVTKVAKRRAIARGARHPAGVQRVSLIQVFGDRAVWVTPRPEVMELPPNLLGPAAAGVREEREVGVGFRRLGGRCRIRHLSHRWSKLSVVS